MRHALLFTRPVMAAYICEIGCSEDEIDIIGVIWNNPSTCTCMTAYTQTSLTLCDCNAYITSISPIDNLYPATQGLFQSITSSLSVSDYSVPTLQQCVNLANNYEMCSSYSYILYDNIHQTCECYDISSDSGYDNSISEYISTILSSTNQFCGQYHVYNQVTTLNDIDNIDICKAECLGFASATAAAWNYQNRCICIYNYDLSSQHLSNCDLYVTSNTLS